MGDYEIMIEELVAENSRLVLEACNKKQKNWIAIKYKPFLKKLLMFINLIWKS